MRKLIATVSTCGIGNNFAFGTFLVPRRFQSGTQEAETKYETAAEKVAETSAATVSVTQFENIKKELKESNEKIAELKKDYLYAMAEAENSRRIGRIDVEKARNYGIASFGKEILEVSDVLEHAIKAFDKIPDITSSKELSSIHTGVKMSQSVLLKNMSKSGIEKMIVNPGDKFDPNLHEALFKVKESEDTQADHIVHVVKTGFKIKDRVLRAAQVGVAYKE